MVIVLKNKYTSEIFICNEIKFDEVANQDVFYGICISEKHKDVFDRRITHQEYLCSWEEVAKNELLNYKNLNK